MERKDDVNNCLLRENNGCVQGGGNRELVSVVARERLCSPDPSLSSLPFNLSLPPPFSPHHTQRAATPMEGIARAPRPGEVRRACSECGAKREIRENVRSARAKGRTRGGKRLATTPKLIGSPEQANGLSVLEHAPVDSLGNFEGRN